MLRFLVGTGLALVIFLQGSSAPFSNTAESQEALVVWEMSDSGDWVLPRVNGMLIPSKPPLYHWFALGFSTLTGGPDERAARLPSIVFGAVTVGVVFSVGAAEWGVATGATAAVVLATSPEWVKWATTARTDATFACFLTVAFLLAERWLRSGNDRLLAAFAAAAGAATLAKGFAAAGLLGLVVAIEVWRRSERRWPPPAALVTAALVFGAIAVSWYAAALCKAGFAFFHKQIVVENVLRFLPNTEGGPSRKHMRLFYAPMLLVGMLPWSIALPTALLRGFRERRTASGESTFQGFLFTWFTVVFIVCTLASGKRTNYILPLYPAAALLIARDLGFALAKARAGVPSRALRASGHASAVLILALAAVLAAWSSGREPWTPVLHWLHAQDQILLPRMAAIIGAPPIWTVALVGLLGAGLAAATARGAWSAAYAIVGAAVALAVFGGCRFVPVLEAEIKSFAPFSQRAAATVDDAPLAFYPTYDFAMLYYLRRHVPVVDRAGFAALPRPSYALVFAPDWDRLTDAERAGAKVVDKSIPASIGRPTWQWLLVRLDPAGGPPSS